MKKSLFSLTLILFAFFSMAQSNFSKSAIGVGVVVEEAPSRPIVHGRIGDPLHIGEVIEASEFQIDQTATGNQVAEPIGCRDSLLWRLTGLNRVNVEVERPWMVGIHCHDGFERLQAAEVAY